MSKIHDYINEEGFSYNVTLYIKNNKLYMVWDDELSEVNLDEVDITIREH